MDNGSSTNRQANSRLQIPDYLIFFLALVLRLIHIGFVYGTPFFSSPILDADVYDQNAWHIAQGDWIGHQAFFQAPLYSYVLAIIYFLFGHSYLIPRLLQALLGALTAWTIYRLGSRLYDRKIGLIAGIIMAIYGPLIFYCGELLATTLHLFLAVLFLLSLDRLIDRPSRLGFLLSGALFALAALTRPNILLFLPFVLLWAFFRLKERRLRILLFIAGVALLILPVTLRNWLVSKDFVLISSQGGVNFYMGNNPWATGHVAWVPGTPKDWWAEGYPATVKIAEERVGHPLKPSEVSAFWWKKAWSDMSPRPLNWAGLILLKLHFLLAGHEISNTEDIYFQRRFSPLLSILMWERGIAFPFGLLLPLSLLGLAFTFNWRRQSHLILFQSSYALSVILFFVTTRYRIPIVPIFAIWAAAGLVMPFRLLKERRLKAYAMTMMAFVILLILVNLNSLKGRDIPGLDGAINLGNKYLQTKQYEKAIAAFREASACDSTSARPVNGAGLALLNLGKIEEARHEFEHAIWLEPSLNQARNNLARILQQQGDLDGAKKQFGEVLKLDSTDVYAQRGFADVALEQGDYELAAVRYSRAFELGAFDAQLISRWAQALLMQKDFAAALEVNAKLLASEPDNARAHHNQARIYIACDSLKQAQRELRTVLRLAPDTPEAREQLNEIDRTLKMRH